MTSFHIRETGLKDYPIIVTWSDYALDFSCHRTLDEALAFIRMNPNIESLREIEVWPVESREAD
jgi:hypothetical protein